MQTAPVTGHAFMGNLLVGGPSAPLLNATSVSAMIIEHLRSVATSITAHRMSFMRLRSWRRVLGWPTTVIGGFVSSVLSVSVFGVAEESHRIKGIMWALSIVAFAINISMEHFKLEDREHGHDLSSKLYTTALRSTQMRLMKSDPSDSVHRVEILTELIAHINIIEQYDMPISEKVLQKASVHSSTLNMVRLDELSLVARDSTI